MHYQFEWIWKDIFWDESGQKIEGGFEDKSGTSVSQKCEYVNQCSSILLKFYWLISFNSKYQSNYEEELTDDLMLLANHHHISQLRSFIWFLLAWSWLMLIVIVCYGHIVFTDQCDYQQLAYFQWAGVRFS